MKKNINKVEVVLFYLLRGHMKENKNIELKINRVIGENFMVTIG